MTTPPFPSTGAWLTVSLGCGKEIETQVLIFLFDWTDVIAEQRMT